MAGWSMDAELSADGRSIEVIALLTFDARPMREFREFLRVELDEAHATELLGKLSLALRELRAEGCGERQ